MARLARLIIPGLPHHVIQRGIRRTNVFADKQDRHVYQRLLKEKCDLYGVNIFSYCWMTNHVHLIAIPEAADSLGQAMRDTHGPYASYFNRKCGFSGHLWQARFYSCVLDETHFWSAIRYVERNPVRAGITHKAENYAWSSAPAHCGLYQDPLLTTLPVDRRLIPNWATWLATEQSISELKTIRQNTRTGRPSGSDSFLDQLEERTGHQVKPRKRGRRPGQKKVKK